MLGKAFLPFYFFTPRHNKYGFTLAEVLITLGIIAVVAVLTLPGLIAEHRNKVLIESTKKTYSIIMNALTLAQQAEGGDNSLVFDTSSTSYETSQKLFKYFNAPKICENNRTDDCKKYYITYKFTSKQMTDGTTTGDSINYPKLILADGAIISVRQNTSCVNHWVTCVRDENGYCKKDDEGNDIMQSGGDDACGYLYFDVNGIKGPNQYGRDAYILKVRTNDAIPNPYNPYGYQSFINILSGKNELVFENYNIGDKL